MKKLDLRGKWTLVTGASAGLGSRLTAVLARKYGANVLAVARRADRLNALRDELRDSGSEIVPLVADLCDPDAPRRIFEQATAEREITGVVLNAGITYYGAAMSLGFDAFDKMLSTNVSSVYKLSQLFAGHLTAKANGGGLLFVSSLASFAPMPYQSAYGATKSFITSYGRSLGYELKPSGVSVTVFAPGGIATEMLELSGLSAKFKPTDSGIMSAERCAELALSAFVRRSPFYIPGGLNRVLATLLKMAPHEVVLPSIAKLYTPPREH